MDEHDLLVVSTPTPLKNMSSWKSVGMMTFHSQYMEKWWNMFQTTN